MNSNSIYIGLIVISPILNQKRYESVFNEILQYLTTHSQELIIQVQNNRFVVFQSSTGSATDQICLPINSNYLHSCYFRLHTGYNLTTEDKKFASIAWEVLNILKENFPSKIFITQENLESCKPQFIPLQPSEELRRQISCLMSIKEEDRYLTVDEFEDAWHTLQFAEKVNDSRSLNTCLEIINSQINNWSNVKNIVDLDTLNRIINKNDYTQLTQNKILAQEILDKVQAALNKVDDNNQTITRAMNDTLQCHDDTISMQSDQGILCDTKDLKNYQNDKPFSTRMCLFQLSESNDINRVTVILQTLSMKSKETLNQLRKKYNFSSKLMNILKKYCNAEYGFEQHSSRNGTFQLNLLQLFTILSQDYTVFQEQLQSQSIEYLSQIIEEGVIYGYEDAISGANNFVNINNKMGATLQHTTSSDLYKFLKLSLDYIELAISKNYQEFLPAIRENLMKIQSRLIKLVQKNDNQILQYFIQNLDNGKLTEIDLKSASQYHETTLNDKQLLQSQNKINLSVDQLTELKILSYPLYEFAVELNNKLLKVQSLLDLQEEHEDKYLRLFNSLNYTVTKTNHINNKNYDIPKQTSNQHTNKQIVQTKVQDQRQTNDADKQKVQSRVQFDLNRQNPKYDNHSYQSKQQEQQMKSLPKYPSMSDNDFNSFTYDQKENIFSQNTYNNNQDAKFTFKRDQSNQKSSDYYQESKSYNYPFTKKYEDLQSPIYQNEQYLPPHTSAMTYYPNNQRHQTYIPERESSLNKQISNTYTENELNTNALQTRDLNKQVYSENQSDIKSFKRIPQSQQQNKQSSNQFENRDDYYSQENRVLSREMGNNNHRKSSITYRNLYS